MIHPHKKSPTLVRILKMSRDVVGSAEYIVPSLEKQVKGVSTPDCVKLYRDYSCFAKNVSWKLLNEFYFLKCME
jgi:hypothetical protein